MMPEYGIQLYSVKDFMQKNVKETLHQIAAMGYRQVEPAGFFGVSAEEFRTWCDESGLTVSGSHSPFSDLEEAHFEETVRYFKTIGCRRFIIPGTDLSDTRAVKCAVDRLNAYAPRLAKEGIELLYHNHMVEFQKNKSGEIPFWELLKRTDVKFEVDIYWAYRAGIDPIGLLQELGGRVSVLHLKDGTMEHGTPLGMGTAPIKEAVAYARKNGIGMVVENEPAASEEMSEAKVCIDYLKQLHEDWAL